ncbi:MAG: OsmC family protein [Actinomycetota bacterium]|jgi:putative redox protein|nr:OsmC family protein [Actinomycetota bacterium]MDQ3922098.1 OsmC family protein [Actinomycetota bacterium]
MGEEQKEVVIHGDGEGFHQEIFVDSHRLAADEPPESGGSGRGPDPYDLLLASLGACTSITLTMHAQSEGLPLRGVTTRLQHSNVHADDCAECETEEGKIDWIELHIELEGPLSDEQRSQLLEIAEKCPVHQTLTSETVIKIGSGDDSG